jgi:hypothetical protein
MATAYHTPPSKLIRLRDPYSAYCLDEAIADYAGRIQSGQKLKPAKTADNRQLIDKLTGG